MNKPLLIGQAELKEAIHYDPETGEFIYRFDRKRKKAGENACIVAQTYYKVRINGYTYQASHLAILYMTGRYPKGIVRYKDGNKFNLKWDNLMSRTIKQRAKDEEKTVNNDPSWSWILNG